MKKGFLSIAFLMLFSALFFGCIKNTPYVTTINPSMTASVSNATFKNYGFVASAVTPATLDTQVVDTSTTLIITGFGSDRVNPYDKIVLAISNYKGVAGVYSVVQGFSGAAYYHGYNIGAALGGVVSITEVTTTTITGYFSFNTADGYSITNGKFTVGLP